MLLVLVVTLSSLEFLGDMQECCSRKLRFECTMRVKCLDAVVDEKSPLFELKLFLVLLHPLKKLTKQQKQTTTRKYHCVLVLSG